MGGAGSDYIKSIIFGGLDGIITTFAIVAAAAGANESWKIVLTFGFANAVADAWSMGIGLLILGGAKGFLTGQSIPITSVKMLFNGTVSGGVSFGIGVLVSYIVTGEAKVG